MCCIQIQEEAFYGEENSKQCQLNNRCHHPQLKPRRCSLTRWKTETLVLARTCQIVCVWTKSNVICQVSYFSIYYLIIIFIYNRILFEHSNIFCRGFYSEKVVELIPNHYEAYFTFTDLSYFVIIILEPQHLFGTRRVRHSISFATRPLQSIMICSINSFSALMFIFICFSNVVNFCYNWFHMINTHCHSSSFLSHISSNLLPVKH